MTENIRLKHARIKSCLIPLSALEEVINMLRKSMAVLSLLIAGLFLSACSGGAGQGGAWVLALLAIVVVGALVLVFLYWLSRRS